MNSERHDLEQWSRDFRWRIPASYNIGADVCDRWAAFDPARVALLEVAADDSISELSFGELRAASNRLANVLSAHAIGRGDRVAILLPQMAEVAITHIAVFKLGAVSLPLAMLFGPEALRFRLRDSQAKALVTTAAGLAKIAAFRDELAELALVLAIDGGAQGAVDFASMLGRAAADFTPVATSADDPAMMIYTSGTTGPPKGALHAHRVLLGHLPGIVMPHEGFPKAGDRFWTPADWAWAGGLLDALLPSLHYGVPVVSSQLEKFDPERALRLMARAGVRNVFMPPTALRMLRAAMPAARRSDIKLRTVAAGGETLGSELYDWGQSALGLTINEFYGQTECNLVLASSAAMGVSRRGAIGKAVPGHEVAVIGPHGALLAHGELGQIAIKRPDPVMFLQYWRRPEATVEKFVGDWLITGDQGFVDEAGYFHFVGRDDDVISSAGYRIGPGEIEDCLIGHPAVSLAAVVGKPDALRTEIVKAFVVLKPGHAASAELAGDIQAFVKSRLSAHEYPREVAFVDALPMTTTGKVMRRLLRERG